MQDERHSGADENTNKKYCDVQYVVHSRDRGELNRHPALQTILVAHESNYTSNGLDNILFTRQGVLGSSVKEYD